MANWLRTRLAALQLGMTQRNGDENDNGGDAAASQAQDRPSR
jgi:hypothetical protein